MVARTRTLLTVGLSALGVFVAALAMVAIPAQPAFAHAILLRTVPAPQSTAPRAPRAVRFEFSERVDIAPGAIRVYDVNAVRVDTGRVQLSSGGRVVDAFVANLRDGTYTVTWRAVSADGHPVRGGFVFYVGSPSSISAKLVPADSGAGRAVGWTYGVVRFAWYSCFLALVGALAIRRGVWTPALVSADATASPAAASFRNGFRRWVRVAWVGLIVSGVARVGLQGASVSGRGLAGALRWTVISSVFHTVYGQLWWWEIGCALALAIPLFQLTARRAPLGGARLWLGLAAANAVVLALATARNGHARTDPHPLVATVSVAAHLLALAVWVGGLAVLLAVGWRAWRALESAARPAVVRAVVTRFSRVAVVAVVIVIITGTINSWFDFASWRDLWSNAYGRAVLAKIVLLAVALAIASRHLFVVPRRLDDPDRAEREVRTFERMGRLELVILTSAVAAAAGLVALVPGRSLALAASGPLTIERRVGNVTVQVFLDDSDAPAQLHLTFVDSSGIAIADISQASVTLRPPAGPPTPIAMRLLSPGHYVGDAPLTAPATYHFEVSARQATTPIATSIRFVYKKSAGSR